MEEGRPGSAFAGRVARLTAVMVNQGPTSPTRSSCRKLWSHVGLRYRLPFRPLFSVLLPTYNTPAKWLVAAIESVRRQSYSHWELCVSDDASTDPKVHKVLRGYERSDKRIRVTYRQENGHISVSSNSAL